MAARQTKVTGLKVPQWLKEWDDIDFDPKAGRSRPSPHFYLFTLRAVDLKALTGIQRRGTGARKKGEKDLGIQRRHDVDRSDEIGQFVRFGYPWSEMSEYKRKSGQFSDLRKPGWLPTAIVVNILGPRDDRGGERVAKKDLVEIRDRSDGTAEISLPQSFADKGWRPDPLHPIEIIDGQHRLWAFEGEGLKGDFSLPVVAFHGLDVSWQAYLFWTINIKPKRINASLAFDLYPLLRAEDWLLRFEGHSIYRETRSQELTESLWTHPESPWHHRINMLGEGRKHVSQAAWIRSLMASFVKAWNAPRSPIGGLFGSAVGSDQQVLPWSRAQQAAFLILIWAQIETAIGKSRERWATDLRSVENGNEEDLAFSGANSLLNTDQGVRVVLQVINDLCYLRADRLALDRWRVGGDPGISEDRVTSVLAAVRKQPCAKFTAKVASAMASYDWRTSGTPGLSDAQRIAKAAFRGSSGYRELRRQILRHLSREKGDLGAVASEAARLLDL